MLTLLRRTALVGLSVLILIYLRVLSSVLSNRSTQVTGILWQADFETGDFTQLTADGGGTISISGQADNKIVTSPTHSGQYSAALTVSNADGITEHPGVRLTRWGITETPRQLPDSAYYSAWYYFPTYVKSNPHWNVFQWKQRRHNPDGTSPTDPVYTISLDNQADGTLKYRLQDKLEPDGSYLGSGTRAALAAMPVPLNRWTHLECLYIWSRTTTGRVTCWQDGVQIWDIRDVQTEFSDRLHPDSISPKRSWTANNYVLKSDPQTHTLYVDDMVISSVQIGPGASASTSTPALPSTGTIIEAESGTITSPFQITNGYVSQTIETDITTGGEAQYMFTVTQPGEYVVNAWVNAPSGGSNSFFINIDDQPTEPTMIWDIPFTAGFEQRLASWRGAGTPNANEFIPKVFTLSAGSHTLIIRGRERDTQLDKFSIDPAPVPTVTPTPADT